MKSFFEEQDDEIDAGTYKIDITELNTEVRFDLLGHLEVTMASKAMKMTVINNMYMDIRVIRLRISNPGSNLSSEANFEATLASEFI